MPMPTSATPIRLGTDGSSLMPVSRAVPTTAPVPSSVSGLGELTPREVEVWHLLAAGLDNVEIASATGISVSTVKNHITSIFAKLRVRDRGQR